jgi:hypothetical protein
MASLTISFKAALTDVFTPGTGAAAEALPQQVGTIREDLNAVYKYVEFTGTTTIAVGDFLCYVLADDTDIPLYRVDGANTALGAGVAMAAVASGTIQYGWIQIEGPATLSTALAGSPAAGDELTTNGETAPAVGKRTAANQQTVAIAANVAAKQVVLVCPH